LKTIRSCRLKCGQKRCRPGCFGCGVENRLLIGLEDSQDARLLRVIRARLIGDAEIGTETVSAWRMGSSRRRKKTLGGRIWNWRGDA